MFKILWGIVLIGLGLMLMATNVEAEDIAGTFVGETYITEELKTCEYDTKLGMTALLVPTTYECPKDLLFEGENL